MMTCCHTGLSERCFDGYFPGRHDSKAGKMKNHFLMGMDI